MKNLSNDVVLHTEKKGIEFLQFRKLLEYEEITHAYVLKNKNFKENKKENYKEVTEALGIDYRNIIRPIQEHTDKVQCIKTGMEELKNTDAILTKERGKILATVNADCILLLFYDPVCKVIANIHSGWKGTLQRISIKTIEKMIQEYHCQAKDIICCINPSIRKCHFEVDREVKIMFEQEFGGLKDWEKCIKKEKEKYKIDTVEINKILLRNIGISDENIQDCNICSLCHTEQLWSYRAEGKNAGRNTAIIELK